MAAKFKKNRPDRLTRLASAIEALGDQDLRQIAENRHVAELRRRGAVELHEACRSFVDQLNAKLARPAVELSPAGFSEDNFDDEAAYLFQINLRGRLLQFEFRATEELYGSDDFKRPYILRGAVRSFNQEFLNTSALDEQMIFYCPSGKDATWYFFDTRTYRTGRVGEDYLTAEMERLL